MKVGLMGLPGSGVTTLFCLFTGRSYKQILERGKIEILLGETRVPDPRLDRLTKMYHPKRQVLPSIMFADVPVELDTTGALTAHVINSLRNLDAVGIVIRAFDNPAVPHPKSTINPLRDLQSFTDEAILTDLLQIEKRRERLKKENRLKSREGELLEELKHHLENDQPIRTCGLSPDEQHVVAGFRFLTQKPWLVLLNTDGSDPENIQEIDTYCSRYRLPWLTICTQMEYEIATLDPEDRDDFLKDLGVDSGASDRFIRLAYRHLKLISFFTVGSDECRAWPIRRGSNSVTAAGAIHTDLARGFIRAQVVSYKDFIEAGTMNAAKRAGKVRLEGKNYIVQDGDLLDIRYNIG
jgi:ribosome-binding ATPase